MRRRRRFTIKVLTVAFAAAALSTPTAQAMPPDLPGDDVRALREAKANNVRAATAKAVRRVSLPRRPIRENDPEG